jgi:hypothetical protein
MLLALKVQASRAMMPVILNYTWHQTIFRWKDPPSHFEAITAHFHHCTLGTPPVFPAMQQQQRCTQLSSTIASVIPARQPSGAS